MSEVPKSDTGIHATADATNPLPPSTILPG